MIETERENLFLFLFLPVILVLFETMEWSREMIRFLPGSNRLNDQELMDAIQLCIINPLKLLLLQGKTVRLTVNYNYLDIYFQEEIKQDFLQKENSLAMFQERDSKKRRLDEKRNVIQCPVYIFCTAKKQNKTVYAVLMGEKPIPSQSKTARKNHYVFVIGKTLPNLPDGESELDPIKKEMDKKKLSLWAQDIRNCSNRFDTLSGAHRKTFLKEECTTLPSSRNGYSEWKLVHNKKPMKTVTLTTDFLLAVDFEATKYTYENQKPGKRKRETRE